MQADRPTRTELELDTCTIPTIWLPRYSNRIELLGAKEKCSYDGLSKRVITLEASKVLKRKLNRALSRLLLLYIGVKFRFWRDLINRDSVNRKSHRRFYPQLISDNVTELWPYRKGLQIVVPYYMEIYRTKTRLAFRKWKMYLRDIRMLLMKMFNRWNVKASRWKLNRLNAARFLQLTEPWGLRIRKALRKYYWPKFRYACDLVLIRRHVKLLFRCWHTVVVAMKKGRKLVKHRTLVLLWENQFEERARQDHMTIECSAIQSKYLTKQILLAWRHAYRRRCLFKRVLMSYCNSSLRKGWVTWVRYAFPPKHRTPPASPRRRVPVPVAAPVPVPESYRRKYSSRLPRVPPHIVVPLAGLHSYAMVHSPGITEKDRIKFRLQRLEHHVQTFEERQRERMTAELLVEVDPREKENRLSLASGTGSANSHATPRTSISAGKPIANSTTSSRNAQRPSCAGTGPGTTIVKNKSGSSGTTAGRPPSGRQKSRSSTPNTASRSHQAGSIPHIKRSATPPIASKKKTSHAAPKYPHTPYF